MTNQYYPAELATIKDFIRWGASYFNKEQLHFGHGTDNAIDEAAALVLYALHLPYNLADMYFDARLSSEEKLRIHALFEKRVKDRVPLAYLTHEAFFAGLSFYVDSRVLVPRSPIAELIEQEFSPWFLGFQDNPRALDLCTGSGCIAIALAMTFTDIEVDAVDLSSDALDVAKINVARYELDDQVNLIESDLFSSLAERRYDLIVSNPPYVCESERVALPKEFTYEPQMGFSGGDDGLDLVRSILRQAPSHLSEQGILVVEVGSSAETLMALYPEIPFYWAEFERGGDGVFILTAEQLAASQRYL